MDQPFQMLVSSIAEFVGRIVWRGKQNQEIMVCNYHDPDATPKKAKAVSIYEFEEVSGDGVHRRQHHCHERYSRHHHQRYRLRPGAVEPLPFVKISAPTLEMTFSVNDSPMPAVRVSSSPPPAPGSAVP